MSMEEVFNKTLFLGGTLPEGGIPVLKREA